MQQAAGWVAAASRIVVLTGAGISTESGIPDYRGPQGLWTRNPQARPVGQAEYRADPAVRRRAWQHRLAHPGWTAEPNAGHRALVDLERTGRLTALLTQNIDGLHQRAGSAPDRVLELHGTQWRAQCLDCGARTAMPPELARVAAGDPDPACHSCGGVLTSATVAFGQPLPTAVLGRAVAEARAAEVFLVVGSSLTVNPVASLCRVALDSGARLVIVNDGPTPYDPVAHALVRGSIGAVLPELLGVRPTVPRG